MGLVTHRLSRRATPSEWLPATAASSGDLSAAADLAVELVKEQLFLRLSGELPYVLQPVTTGAKRFPDGGVLFTQTIFVRSEPVRPLRSCPPQGCRSIFAFTSRDGCVLLVLRRPAWVRQRCNASCTWPQTIGLRA